MIGKWKLEEFQEAHINRHFAEQTSIKNLTDFFTKNKNRMPNFLERHFEIVRYHEENFYFLDDRPIVQVPVDQLYGTSWVFKSTELKPENAELLAHYFLHRNPDALPEAIVRKINDTKYLLVEGSHQLYTAYLYKWPYILVEVQAEYKGEDEIE
jgi:hypothetical protein